MSYIKPLNGPVGPKQTKCEIRDETIYSDFDDYVVTLTTTRTPDVPSGGVFAVKTRTCIMWASAISTRVIVTTQVDWTGRSFIKGDPDLSSFERDVLITAGTGIIERSAIEGQKVYHSDLEKAMRAYISEHQSEFIPEGVDPAELVPVIPPPAAETATTKATAAEIAQDPKKRERERNQRAFQWAWDTFEGARSVASQSTKGALELIRDAWDQSTSTTILIFVIVILIMSNIYTWLKMGSREELGRRKEIRKMEDREQWIQGVVTALWDELAAGKGAPVGLGVPPAKTPAVPSNIAAELDAIADWKGEVASLVKTLDGVEERIRRLRGTLHSLQGLDSLD